VVFSFCRKGDADLYISDTLDHPTFDYDSHSMSAWSCGIDKIDVPRTLPRPLHIAVYGHPRYDVRQITYIFFNYMAYATNILRSGRKLISNLKFIWQSFLLFFIFGFWSKSDIMNCIFIVLNTQWDFTTALVSFMDDIHQFFKTFN